MKNEAPVKLEDMLFDYVDLRDQNSIEAERRYKGKRVYVEGDIVSIDQDSTDETFPCTVIISIPRIVMDNYDTCLFVCCKFTEAIAHYPNIDVEVGNGIDKITKGMTVIISGDFCDECKVEGLSSIRKVTIENCFVDYISKTLDDDEEDKNEDEEE